MMQRELNEKKKDLRWCQALVIDITLDPKKKLVIQLGEPFIGLPGNNLSAI